LGHQCYRYDAASNTWIEKTTSSGTTNQDKDTHIVTGWDYGTTFNFIENGNLVQGPTDKIWSDSDYNCVIRINSTMVIIVRTPKYFSIGTNAHYFDYVDNQWTQMRGFPFSMKYPGCGAVKHKDGKVQAVVTSSNEFYIYDFKSNNWRRSRYRLPWYVQSAASVQCGNTILLVGGTNGEEILEYQASSESWIRRKEKIKKMTGISNPKAVVVDEGVIPCT
jgi:N-acetylneuraminic acid mutarotase